MTPPRCVYAHASTPSLSSEELKPNNSSELPTTRYLKTAFLNGELEETIYMKEPEGYEEGGSSMVCHLHKSLYGLRQAPRAWHARLKTELESMGFTASEADPGLYTANFKDGKVFILVYVDDILVVGKTMDSINHVKSKLEGVFDVRDLGEASYFLSINIIRDRPSKYQACRVMH